MSLESVGQWSGPRRFGTETRTGGDATESKGDPVKSSLLQEVPRLTHIAGKQKATVPGISVLGYRAAGTNRRAYILRHCLDLPDTGVASCWWNQQQFEKRNLVTFQTPPALDSRSCLQSWGRAWV